MRIREHTAGFGRAMLAGGFLLFGLFRMGEPEKGIGAALGFFVFGAVYGLVVLGLIRLFRTSRFGLLVAGLLAGPVPVALLAGDGEKTDERFGMWLIASLLGLAIGILEWSRSSAREREEKNA